MILKAFLAAVAKFASKFDLNLQKISKRKVSEKQNDLNFMTLVVFKLLFEALRVYCSMENHKICF